MKNGTLKSKIHTPWGLCLFHQLFWTLAAITILSFVVFLLRLPAAATAPLYFWRGRANKAAVWLL